MYVEMDIRIVISDSHNFFNNFYFNFFSSPNIDFSIFSQENKKIINMKCISILIYLHKHYWKLEVGIKTNFVIYLFNKEIFYDFSSWLDWKGYKSNDWSIIFNISLFYLQLWNIKLWLLDTCLDGMSLKLIDLQLLVEKLIWRNRENCFDCDKILQRC